jgi:hypothetical protein
MIIVYIYCVYNYMCVYMFNNILIYSYINTKIHHNLGLIKMSEFHKRYKMSELATVIVVCDDMEYDLSQCRYVYRLL